MRLPPKPARAIGLVLVLTLTLSGFTCYGNTKNLAVASQAISHALLNAQQASQQALQQGIINQADESDFEILLSKAAQTGLILDEAIRSGESSKNVSDKAYVFLEAFEQLNKAGLAGIKNQNLKLTISTILNGAEASIAVIVATVGTGSGSGTSTSKPGGTK